jgi:hypothetical protein
LVASPANLDRHVDTTRYLFTTILEIVLFVSGNCNAARRFSKKLEPEGEGIELSTRSEVEGE